MTKFSDKKLFTFNAHAAPLLSSFFFCVIFIKGNYPLNLDSDLAESWWQLCGIEFIFHLTWICYCWPAFGCNTATYLVMAFPSSCPLLFLICTNES